MVILWTVRWLWKAEGRLEKTLVILPHLKVQVEKVGAAGSEVDVFSYIHEDSRYVGIVNTFLLILILRISLFIW